MEKITIWKAHGDAGSDRGVGPVIAYCSTEAQAQEAARGQGWYGGNGHVGKAHALRIDGEVWLLERETPIDLDSAQAKRDAELREKTLASLSPEQKRVLRLAV